MQASTKQRLFFTAIGLSTILLGLASRKYRDSLPMFIGEYAVDTLWGMMLLFCFRGCVRQSGAEASRFDDAGLGLLGRT